MCKLVIQDRDIDRPSELFVIANELVAAAVILQISERQLVLDKSFARFSFQFWTPQI